MRSDAAPAKAVVCRVGTHRFALASGDGREVCTGEILVQMPGVALPVEGVINLRGTLVTIIRGSALMPEAGQETGGPSAWFVVLRYRDGRVGLGVDEVVDFAIPPAGVGFLHPDARLEPLFRRVG